MPGFTQVSCTPGNCHGGARCSTACALGIHRESLGELARPLAHVLTAANSSVCLSNRNWVTGFSKRKQQRREYGAIQLAKKQRIARNEARKLVRHSGQPA